MATLPIFGAGNYENILKAISQGTISYPAWMYCRDEKKLGFVERDGSFVLMKGDNKEQVVYLDKLPEISDGDTEVLYIVGTICYKFDGSKFVMLGKDHTAELEALTERVSNLESKTTNLETKVTELESKVVDLETKTDELDTKVINLETKVVYLEATDATLAEQIKALKEQIEAIEIPDACDCGDKYEVSHKPTGTLVDYREKEIRIMCPTNTEWVLQQSGENADKNKYYIGVKAYAPNDDVVSFKEAIDKTVSDDTMYYFENNDFAGIDDEGRKYSIIWLPVAVNENGSWRYYGASSTTKHYVGWYYSVEWYDANEKVVKSDCIRINLSNESCHNSIEPYYLVELQQQINDVVEQLVEYEDRIVEVEKATLTFVELE